MAFIGSVNQGKTYAPGYFLANGDEEVIRETREISQSSATSTDTGKYVKMGTVYPSNDSNAEGLLYEDVDVTVGNMPGSVVTGNAVVDENKIPTAVTTSAKNVLIGKGFRFIAATSIAPVVRPNWNV